MNSDIKTSFKIIIFSITITLFLFITITLRLPPWCWEHDSYDSYVDECHICHQQGMGYAICSGFCYPNMTRETCVCCVPLDESCEDNIAHGSITGWRDCIWD